MHGRVFHDITKTPLGLKEICKTNMINDDYKKVLAILNNRKYIVFWDDEFQSWKDQIKSIFNRSSISYAEAKNIVNEESGKSTNI
jgi:hypothetical protein